jgi:hypothetical protein
MSVAEYFILARSYHFVIAEWRAKEAGFEEESLSDVG